jgi:hypothetical protein
MTFAPVTNPPDSNNQQLDEVKVPRVFLITHEEWENNGVYASIEKQESQVSGSHAPSTTSSAAGGESSNESDDESSESENGDEPAEKDWSSVASSCTRQ